MTEGFAERVAARSPFDACPVSARRRLSRSLESRWRWPAGRSQRQDLEQRSHLSSIDQSVARRRNVLGVFWTGPGKGVGPHPNPHRFEPFPLSDRPKDVQAFCPRTGGKRMKVDVGGVGLPYLQGSAYACADGLSVRRYRAPRAHIVINAAPLFLVC